MSGPEISLPEVDLEPGACWLVATPIGNLGDITLRALAVLGACDVVYAEDTRQTRRLLSRYGLSRPLEAYHDHNKDRAVPRIVERLRAGERVAVVSDAGMPCISDPGFTLVRALREAGLPWSVAPGPSSTLAALGFAPALVEKVAARMRSQHFKRVLPPVCGFGRPSPDAA